MEEKSDKTFEMLVKQALEGKQSDFEFVRNLAGLKVLNIYIRGMRKVVKSFKTTRDAMMRLYMKQVEQGKQDIELTFAVMQFTRCIEYYSKELAIAKDMRKEYKTYVMSGHLLDTLFGYTRPDSDLVDFRKLPVKWF